MFTKALIRFPSRYIPLLNTVQQRAIQWVPDYSYIWKRELKEKERNKNHDMTPDWFGDHNIKGTVHICKFQDMFARRPPPVPPVDERKVKNKYFVEVYERPIRIVEAFKELEFPAALWRFEDLDAGKENEMLEELEASLKINLSVSYGAKNNPLKRDIIFWTIDEVQQWMDIVELSKFKDVFKLYKINGLALQHLTLDHLERMKISNPVDRHEIIEKIHTVDFYYDSALMGNYLEVGMCLEKPRVLYPLDNCDHKEGDLYTLIMFSPDYPFRLFPDKGQFVNWLVTNIPNNKVKNGEEVVEYLPPIPTDGAGVFRYVFQLYKQSKKIDSSELQSMFKKTQNDLPYNEINRRRHFDLLEFIEQQGLGAHPSGMTFFRTAYDLPVKQIYKDINVEEPVYVPPSFKPRDYKKKRTRKELRQQWI